MATQRTITKKQLIQIIDELENKPEDKMRILSQSGITVGGAVLGAAAAGSIASVAGATSIFGVTSAASWLGVSVVAATPVGWIIGAAVGAGAAAYGISTWIHSGGISEGRKLELLQKFRDDRNKIDAKEKSNSISNEDRTRFIVSLKELIENNILPPNKALDLISKVEQGQIDLSHAFLLIEGLIQERK